MLMMLARLYVWAVTDVSSSTRGVRTDPTDAQLIDAALSGDAKAFETLLRRNLDAMYAIALRITLDEGDTDDVVQEASVRIWRVLHTFRREARVSTWIYRITTNLALSHVARRRDASLDPEKHEPADHAADPARRVEDQARLGAALEVFSRLPVNQRSCLALRESHGLSYEEIAEVSDISVAAVKGRLFRARQSLAEQLAAFEACTRVAEERP